MNSIAHQNLSRGEKMIIDYLKRNGGEFAKPQKYLAKKIGYVREVTNIFLKRLEVKGLVKLEKRIGVDTRLKVIILVKEGQTNG